MWWERSRPSPTATTLGGLEPKANCCVVYDTDSYSFASIFHIFAAHPKAGVVMGTFSKQAAAVITIGGVYK